MNTNTTRIASGAAAIVAVGLIVAGAWGFGSIASADPESTPTPTPIVGAYIGTDGAVEGESSDIATATQRIAAAEAEAARLEAERVAAEAAAAEAARIAAEQEAARQAQQNTQNTQNSNQSDAPSGPIKCPPGSLANSNDGVNDTSCFPEICFSIMVPDPNHPECDVAFRP